MKEGEGNSTVSYVALNPVQSSEGAPSDTGSFRGVGGGISAGYAKSLKKWELEGHG